MNYRIKKLLVIALLVYLAGCDLAPRYVRPEAPVPSDWSGQPAGEAMKNVSSSESGDNPATMAWRDFFSDEALEKIIGLALENNRDLRIAALNVERFRQFYRIERAGLFPHVDATASGTKQRIPEGLSSTGKAQTVEQYGVGLGVSSFELDLFGRVSNLKEKALAEYLATEQAYKTVQIALVAQVGATYLNLAADEERLALSRETLKAREASHGLMQKRFDLGVSSELDLRQSETALEAARADLARYTTLAAQDKNALNLLVGSALPPELLPGEMTETLAAVEKIAPHLPSELLLSRPDVMAAESRLRGVNANIGAARAAYFPRITLTGSVGMGSDELSSLFDSGSGTWLFAPKMVLPIFDAGSRAAGVKVAEADRDIALARYELTIQRAFREVADVLARQETMDEQLAAQQSLTDAAEASYRLSMARYEKGIDSYLSVLDSLRYLYSARQELIATRLIRFLNVVTLYKVLGGGAR